MNLGTWINGKETRNSFRFKRQKNLKFDEKLILYFILYIIMDSVILIIKGRI